MDRELFEHILQQLHGREIKKFTVQGYGEPLLDKNFCHYVRRAKEELDCPTFTVSNGSIITPELAQEMVDCGLDKIKISFYGTNKEEYEAVHRRLSYEKTVRGIELLVAAKRAARSKMIIRLQYIGKWWKFIPFALAMGNQGPHRLQYASQLRRTVVNTTRRTANRSPAPSSPSRFSKSFGPAKSSRAAMTLTEK